MVDKQVQIIAEGTNWNMARAVVIQEELQEMGVRSLVTMYDVSKHDPASLDFKVDGDVFLIMDQGIKGLRVVMKIIDINGRHRQAPILYFSAHSSPLTNPDDKDCLWLLRVEAALAHLVGYVLVSTEKQRSAARHQAQSQTSGDPIYDYLMRSGVKSSSTSFTKRKPLIALNAGHNSSKGWGSHFAHGALGDYDTGDAQSPKKLTQQLAEAKFLVTDNPDAAMLAATLGVQTIFVALQHTYVNSALLNSGMLHWKHGGAHSELGTLIAELHRDPVSKDPNHDRLAGDGQAGFRIATWLKRALETDA